MVTCDHVGTQACRIHFGAGLEADRATLRRMQCRNSGQDLRTADRPRPGVEQILAAKGLRTQGFFQ